jgi:peptidoglycan/xylan/chitin deacetylase (PgdA/CDA1 family)
MLGVAGCATTPEPAPVPAAPAPVVAPPPIAGPVVNRDRDFALVVVGSTDTPATLAARCLGDAGKAWQVREANSPEALRPGQIAAIPLRVRNPVGVQANGYQTVPILCYHRFGNRWGKLAVTPAAFEAQMEHLARNGYHVISLKQLARFLEGTEALPPKSVVVTIDDGYRSTYDIAFPVLRKHGFQATVFLYSDFVGASDALTWAQMKEMTASGLIDIEPHSKTHANLTLRLPGESEARFRDRVKREIDAPIAALRERMGEPSFTYAYPYGDVNEYVVELLQRQGIKQGVTVTPGGNGFFAYPYMLRRSMVFGGEDLDTFKSKLVTFARTNSR